MGYFNSKKTKWRGKMNYNDMIYLQHYGVSIQKIKEMDTVTTETLAEAIEKEKNILFINVNQIYKMILFHYLMN